MCLRHTKIVAHWVKKNLDCILEFLRNVALQIPNIRTWAKKGDRAAPALSLTNMIASPVVLNDVGYI